MAQLAKVFCTNIYKEMEGIFSRGVDPGVDQDLVMEQVSKYRSIELNVHVLNFKNISAHIESH